MKYEDLRGKIADLVQQQDPMGLIERGAPDDEYSSEIDALTKKILELPDRNLRAIEEVLEGTFSEEHFGLEPSRAKFHEIANKIIEELTSS